MAAFGVVSFGMVVDFGAGVVLAGASRVKASGRVTARLSGVFLKFVFSTTGLAFSGELDPELFGLAETGAERTVGFSEFVLSSSLPTLLTRPPEVLLLDKNLVPAVGVGDEERLSPTKSEIDWQEMTFQPVWVLRRSGEVVRAAVIL